MTAPRDLDWARAHRRRRAGRVRARWRRPTRSTSSTRPGPPRKPKGVVRDNGGHAVALAWSMANIYDVGPGDVWWTASDVGWVVGHSYIVYAPLLVGATTVLYEGKPVGTPDAGRVLAGRRRARRAGAVHRADRLPGGQEGGPDRPAPRGRTTSRACGRCSSPASGSTRTPSSGRPTGSGVPVIDHWWQTETGWPIAANLRGLEPMPIKPGSPTVPVPGLRRAGARPVRRARCRGGTEGAICIRLPLPPGDPADAVGRRRALRRRPTCRPSTATTSPATAATSTRTATCS